MATFLSDEEVFTPAKGTAKAEPAAAKFLSDEDVFKPSEPAFVKEAKKGPSAMSVMKDVGGYALGVIGQIEDMLATVPRVGALIQAIPVAARAAIQGESAKTVAGSALATQEDFMPGWLQGAFGKIAEALGPQAKHYYENNGVAKFLQGFGEQVLEKSDSLEKKTGVPAELVQYMVNAGMDVLGAKGTVAGVKGSMRARGDAAKAKVMERQFKPYERTEAEAAAALKPTEPAAPEGVKPIPEVVEVDKDVLKELFKKGPKLTEEQAANKEVDGFFKKALDEATVRGKAAPEGWREATPEEVVPPEAETKVDAATGKTYVKAGAAAVGTVAAGAYLAANPEEAEKLGWTAAAMAGAIRLEGNRGSIHPKLIEDLSDAVAGGRLMTAEEAARIPRTPEQRRLYEENLARPDPVRAWAPNAVRRYAQKYLGTERDPLKDIEIPKVGGGTIRWEDAMDQALKGTPAKELKGEAYAADQKTPLMNVPDAETVWSIQDRPSLGRANTENIRANHAANTIKQYISHASDYLQQRGYTLEQLKNIDLTRVIKETAAWDKELAKKMEKANTDIASKATTYKDYGDGMRWVQLDKPGQFAWNSDRMGHSVRGYEPAKVPGPDSIPPRYEVRSILVKELNRSPSETEIDARQAELSRHPDWIPESGDSGHPSYGLGGWEAIKRGDAKVYTLVDKKGEPHVTVEVDNSRVKPNTEPLDQQSKFKEASITQIKGKQNRAPDKAYLPYVQDLVKNKPDGGQWGDVGDLRNTGLTKVRGKFMSNADIAERAGVDTETANNYMEGKIAPGEPGYTNLAEFLTKGTERPQGGSQRGSIDPNNIVDLGIGIDAVKWARTNPELAKKTLVTLAAGSAGAIFGAYVDNKDPLAGAMWGGLLSAALAGKFPFREALGKVDKGLGLIPTRLGNIRPELKWRLIDSEQNFIKLSHDWVSGVDDFLTRINRPKRFFRQDALTKEQIESVNDALLSNKPGEIAAAIKATGDAKLAAEYAKVRNVLDNEMGKRLEDRGVIKRTQEDYFPRRVKDYPGLMASPAIDAKIKPRILSKVAIAEASALKERGTGLTPEERTTIINKELEASYPPSNQPGFAKRRTIKEVTKELAQFYDTPTEALHGRIIQAAQDVAKAEFFGRDLRVTKKGGLQYTNNSSSIGALVDRLITEGKLPPEKFQEVRDLIRARFSGGEGSPWKVLQDTKNLINTGLLANWGTATRQLGDLATVAVTQGLLNTIEGTARTLTGNARLNIKTYGLADHISEEFVNTRKTAQFQNKMFKYTFAPFDSFGKNVSLETALVKMEKLSQTPKGVKELQAKFGEVYGDNFPEFIADLQKGKITELTKAPPFHELADMQPITRSNTSEWALNNPNGKAIYGWLRSYIHQQSDLVRRLSYEEIKRGNVAKGVTNLVKYTLYLGTANATVNSMIDYIQGKPWALEPWDVPLNVLKNFGWSQQAREEMQKGRPIAAIGGFISPPFRVMDDIVSRSPKVLRYIPFIGDQLYARYGGGNENRAKWDAIEKRRADPAFKERQKILQQRKEEKAAGQPLTPLPPRNTQPMGNGALEPTIVSDTPGQGVQSRAQFAERQINKKFNSTPSMMVEQGKREELDAMVQRIHKQHGGNAAYRAAGEISRQLNLEAQRRDAKAWAERKVKS